MKRNVEFISLFLGLLLFTRTCEAHSLEPIFRGLGPIAPVITVCSIIGWLPLAILIVAQAWLLHYIIPAPFDDCLGKALVIFVISRVVELLPVFINGDILIGYDPNSEFNLIVTLMIAIGVLANALLIWMLFHSARPHLTKVLGLSVLLEILSSGGMYVINAFLLYFQFVR